MNKKLLFAGIAVIALIVGVAPLMIDKDPEQVVPEQVQVNQPEPNVATEPAARVPYKGRIDELRRAEYYLQTMRPKQFNDPEEQEMKRRNIDITERRIEALKAMTDEQWQQEMR